MRSWADSASSYSTNQATYMNAQANIIVRANHRDDPGLRPQSPLRFVPGLRSWQTRFTGHLRICVLQSSSCDRQAVRETLYDSARSPYDERLGYSNEAGPARGRQ